MMKRLYTWNLEIRPHPLFYCHVQITFLTFAMFYLPKSENFLKLFYNIKFYILLIRFSTLIVLSYDEVTMK